MLSRVPGGGHGPAASPGTVVSTPEISAPYSTSIPASLSSPNTRKARVKETKTGPERTVRSEVSPLGAWAVGAGAGLSIGPAHPPGGTLHPVLGTLLLRDPVHKPHRLFPLLVNEACFQMASWERSTIQGCRPLPPWQHFQHFERRALISHLVGSIKCVPQVVNDT